MHATAMSNCETFFSSYTRSLPKDARTVVVEVGSQDVNGTLRSVCPQEFSYIGLDFQAAKGVDIVMEDPYSLPLESDSVDIVLSSSCFEHSQMFWLVFLEIMRVLKRTGLFYLNAPSAGSFHRYPVDCWRFYPDSGKALIAWSKRNGGTALLLESFTQKGGGWQDFVGVFAKSEYALEIFPNRILDLKKDFENGLVYGSEAILNPTTTSQNDRKLQVISQIINETLLVK